MTIVGQIYYCMHCHNTVLMVGEGEGVLVCCGAKMRLLEEHNPAEKTDAWEYHIPQIFQSESGVVVKIGEKIHPMDDNHFISWIELQLNGVSLQYSLDPLEDKFAEAVFPLHIPDGTSVIIRAVCNVHGLWRN